MFLSQPFLRPLLERTGGAFTPPFYGLTLKTRPRVWPCGNRDYDSVNPLLCFFNNLLRAAMDFFFNRTLGFSKCSRFLTSESIPAFSQDFLNLRKADSKLSPSLILTDAMLITFLPDKIYPMARKIGYSKILSLRQLLKRMS